MIDEKIPDILSVEFHARFFPRLLRDRLRPLKKAGPTFVSHAFLEGMIGLAICALLIAWGLPSALSRGSIFGWLLTVLGSIGIAALTGSSVYGQWGTRPDYRNFLAGIFFFFLTLGLYAGLLVPGASHAVWKAVLADACGIVAGYAIGILAGLWMQYLGWMALVLNMVAGFGAIVLLGTSIVMLFYLK